MNFIKKNLRQFIFILFFIIFLITFFAFKLNTYFTVENLVKIRENFHQFSFFGPIIVIFFYIIFNLVIMPTFFFNLLTGYLYGPVYGLILGWFGMSIGLFASFINSRYLFKKGFLAKFKDNRYFMILEEYTQKHHGLIVIFLRIFFIIPYNFQNVLYGLTSIHPVKYFIFSAIGVLPITLIYVFLGHLAALQMLGVYELKKITGLLIGLILFLAGIIITTIILKNKLALRRQ